MRRFIVVSTLLLASSALAAPPPESAEEPVPIASAMHDHLGMVERMHKAVIEGNLVDSRAAAQELADPKNIADVPEVWQPWLSVMRDSASRAAGDWSQKDAARTVTEVARSCGACHAFTNGGPPAPTAPMPDGIERHAWAANAMWYALMRNDASAFTAAGEALRASDMGNTPKKEVVVIRQLATRATHAQSRSLMADTYGELLGKCASCHERAK